MTNMKEIKSILGAVLMLGMTTSTLVAQVTGATMTGKVTDPNGAVIPNASVELVRSSTDTHRTFTSNETGVYTAPNLQPGTYKVTVTAQSFGSTVLTGVDLEVGQTVDQDFTLKPGSVTQQIEVSTQSPALD